MSNWWSNWSWMLSTAALAATAGVVSAQPYDLQIITPHNEQIQQEFEQAFIAHAGRPVRIRWIKQGTGQLLDLLEAAERKSPGKSFDLDVFFGGGVPDHQLAAQRNYTQPITLAPEVRAAIPADIAGVANYDPDGRWVGAALSSFGVLMNRRGLAAQQLSPIRTWEDLGDPRMYSWVVLADPRKSASVRVSYELILQQYGWERGWTLLMQMAGNARQIVDASSAIPNEVASGNVLAGPCIDFYGRARVAQAGADVLAYVNPVGGSAITPDPISLLRQPPNPQMADAFINFVLSPAGQRLWMLPPGQAGGPRQHALYRLPVRQDVFDEQTQALGILNPYAEARAGVFRRMDDELQNRRTLLVAELFGAALADLHGDVRTTWKALIDSGMKPAAVQEWAQPPFSEAEGFELAQKIAAGDREAKRITRDWTRSFKSRFERVRALAR